MHRGEQRSEQSHRERPAKGPVAPSALASGSFSSSGPFWLSLSCLPSDYWSESPCFPFQLFREITLHSFLSSTSERLIMDENDPERDECVVMNAKSALGGNWEERRGRAKARPGPGRGPGQRRVARARLGPYRNLHSGPAKPSRNNAFTLPYHLQMTVVMSLTPCDQMGGKPGSLPGSGLGQAPAMAPGLINGRIGRRWRVSVKGGHAVCRPSSLPG